MGSSGLILPPSSSSAPIRNGHMTDSEDIVGVATIVPAVAAAFVGAYGCFYMVKEVKIFGGEKAHTHNKKWAAAIEYRLANMERQGSETEVAMNPLAHHYPPSLIGGAKNLKTPGE